MGRGLPQSTLIVTLFLAFFVFALVSSCGQQYTPPDDETTIPVVPNPDVTVRPEIPRSDPGAPGMNPESGAEAITTRPGSSATPYSFLNTESFTRQGLASLVIGDATHPFLVGDVIGDVTPVLTRQELRMLAMRQPSLKGRSLRAESYVRFDFEEESTGLLRLVRDPETETLDEELFFAEGRPMFEYAYLLQDGAFPLLVGEELDFFGATYLVQEANNHTVILYGRNVPQYVTLSNGSSLDINGTSYADTRVTVDPWSVIITYDAPDPDRDGVRLKRGESLRQKLKKPEILLNPLFDVKFEGLERSAGSAFILSSDEESVTLSYEDSFGEPSRFDLAFLDGSTLRWGGEDGALRFERCASASYCIREGESFLVNTRDDTSWVFTMKSVTTLGDALFVKDQTGEEHHVKLVDTKRREQNCSVLEGTLQLADTIIPVRVLHNETPQRDRSRLRVETAYGERTLFLASDHEARFPKKNETTDSFVVEFVSPRLTARIPGRSYGLEEEVLPLRITVEDGELRVGVAGETLEQAREDKDVYGMVSQRGVLVTLRESEDGVTGETLAIDYPADYRAGIVRIYG